MINSEKVVWHEGVFLSPQHFQQQDKFLEKNDFLGVKHSRAFNYGFHKLKINDTSFKEGIFKLDYAEVIFPNGKILVTDDYQVANLCIKLPSNLKTTRLFLCIPKTTLSKNHTSIDSNNKEVRYITFQKSVIDHNDVSKELKQILVARENPVLLIESQLTNAYLSIPIAIVQTNDKNIVSVDSSYIPASLSVQNQEKLADYVNEITGLLLQKSENLSQAVNDPNKGGTIEVLDFMMLQTVNRYLAYLLHEKNGATSTHPEFFFVNLSKLCADLMTFLPSRKIDDMPVYDHDNLGNSFHDLINKLRLSLSKVLEQRIIRIPMSQQDEATYVAQTPEKTILGSSTFVLAVKADMSIEDLRQSVPETMKISTADNIQELIGFHLSGIRLNALSVAPRELPYHNGYVYFELDKQNELWESFYNSPTMAFHLAGNFPNVSFEFWAIKPTMS